MIEGALLVGGGGQLGREVARIARERGAPMAVTTRQSLDVTDADAVERAFDTHAPTIVINASAYTAVDTAESEPDLAFAVNRDGPHLLARACARHSIPLIHVSTDYVYDGSKPEPYLETDPVAPLGVYGQSKLAGEDAVRAALPDGHIIVRTAWVYGAHGGNFVKTMLRLSETRDALNVVDDQHGCPTAAAELAAALVTMAERIAKGDLGSRAFGVFHGAGGGETSWYGFAREIFAQANRPVTVTPIPTNQYPTPARRPANSRLDCSKLHAVYGLRLRPWRSALADVLSEL